MRKPRLGLDFGTNSIKVVHARGDGHSLEVVLALIFDYPHEWTMGQEEGPQVLALSLKEFLRKKRIPTCDTYVSVSDPTVYLRAITLPPLTDHEISESLRWHAEKFLPSPASQASLSYHRLDSPPAPEGAQTGQTAILLIALSKKLIEQVMSVLRQAGLPAVSVKIPPFAQSRIIGRLYATSTNPVAVVDIGASTTFMTIVRNGTLSFTRNIRLGGRDFTRTLQTALDLDPSEAERMKHGMVSSDWDIDFLLSPLSLELATRIQRSLTHYEFNIFDQVIETIVVSGGGALSDTIVKSLRTQLGITVQRANPFSEAIVKDSATPQSANEDIAPIFTTAVGLVT